MTTTAPASMPTDENIVPLGPHLRDAAQPAKLVVLIGPQNSGKSFMGRVLIERAREQGREPLVCDGDRNTPDLTRVFGKPGERDGEVVGVRRPEFADDDTVTGWLDGELSDMEDDGRSRLVDMSGGDPLLPGYIRERELVGMLAGARKAIVPVAFHMILPNVSDLADLERMEADDLFTPAATILALNAGPVSDTRPAAVVFRHVRESEVYRAALARGAREIVVPALGCMGRLEELGLSFDQAAARSSPLGLAHRQQVVTFRRRLYAELDRVAQWLP